MEGEGAGPKDPRKDRRPKDSEFYQIPPDLKKEFDMLMTERVSDSPLVERMSRALQKRKRLATASLVLGVLGGALVGVGPILAIVLGVIARRTGRDIEKMPATGMDMAKFGIFLGIVMLLANAVILYFLLKP